MKCIPKYDSIYEMRATEMHCSICGVSGTREELEDNDCKGKTEGHYEVNRDIISRALDLVIQELLWKIDYECNKCLKKGSPDCKSNVDGEACSKTLRKHFLERASLPV